MEKFDELSLHKFEGSCARSEQRFAAVRAAPSQECRPGSLSPAQRKPDTPTQVNDTPRAFPKGHMGLKMATTQQAR